MSSAAYSRVTSGNGPRAHPSRRVRRRGPRLAHFVATAVLACIGAIPFVPVQLPFVVDTYGQVKSAQEWALVRGADGQLTASVFHYDTGLGGDFGVFQFGSEGSVRFSFHSSLSPGRTVAAGDTIGAIYSSEVQERIVALNGKLTAARASLAVHASGGRSTTVREAQQRLHLARQKHEEHLKELERTSNLFAEGLITEGRYERAKSDAKLLEVQIDIAETELEAVRSGSKQEQLELTRANITALEDEMDAVRQRAASLVLTAPISGAVFRPFSSDTLLTIADTANYAVYLLVQWADYPYVSQARNIRVRPNGSSQTVRGRLTSLSQKVRVVDGSQVVMATAVLEDPPAALMPGMLASCRIECPPVSALEYLKRLFNSLVT